MRQRAKQNYEQEKGMRRRFRIVDPTRFELCMLGIREELTLGRATFQNVPAVEARLRRVSEDIERVRKELAANRQLQ